ncbi:MAG: hypothetical protein ACI4RA_00305 [Kiritimatiellia bacterium]
MITTKIIVISSVCVLMVVALFALGYFLDKSGESAEAHEPKENSNAR